MKKVLIYIYITLIFSVFFMLDIKALKIMGSGQNKSIACLSKDRKSYQTCEGNGCSAIESCNENKKGSHHNIVTHWKLNDGTKDGTSLFCLDNGLKMNHSTVLNQKDTISNKDMACGIYSAYKELANGNNSNYSTIVNNMNAKTLNPTNYIVLQKNLWQQQNYKGKCDSVVLYKDSTPNGTINLSVSSFELTLDNSNKYYVSNPITISTSNLDSSTYKISVNGASGAFATTSASSTSGVTISNSRYIYI